MLQLQVNDALLAVTCTPSTALPEGPVMLSATIEDFAGNVSALATLYLSIDTLPPATSTLGQVTVGPVTNG